MVRLGRRNEEEYEDEDVDNGNENDEDEDDDEDDDDGDDEDPLALLPGYVLARVGELQVLHAQRESLVGEYMKERAALEKKYEDLFKPLYDERAAIVHGLKDEEIDSKMPPPSDEGIASAEEGDNNNDNNINGDAVVDRVKGVPQFWASAMSHIDTIGELICVQDVDCLEYLMNVTCDHREDGKGFTLSFHFAPNEYFTNTVLTKTYEVPNLLVADDEPMLKQVLGDKIHWKPGKSLTHKTIKKKQRGKGKHAGQVRTITKEEEQESFFHWFAPPPMPTDEAEMDEEEAEHLEEVYDNDYSVAQAFRCHLIPHAVRWFAGQGEGEESNDEAEGQDDNN